MVLVIECENCGYMIYTRNGNMTTKIKYISNEKGVLIPIDYTKIHIKCPPRFSKQLGEEDE